MSAVCKCLAVANWPQRERDRIDLMRIRIDAPVARTCRVSALLAGPPKADEILCQERTSD